MAWGRWWLANTNTAAQLAVRTTAAREMWYRRKSGGIWQPWVQGIDSANYSATLQSVGRFTSSTLALAGAGTGIVRVLGAGGGSVALLGSGVGIILIRGAATGGVTLTGSGQGTTGTAGALMRNAAGRISRTTLSGWDGRNRLGGRSGRNGLGD